LIAQVLVGIPVVVADLATPQQKCHLCCMQGELTLEMVV